VSRLTVRHKDLHFLHFLAAGNLLLALPTFSGDSLGGGGSGSDSLSVDSTASVSPYREAQGRTVSTCSGSQERPSCAAHFFSGGAAEPLLCGCVGGKRQTSTPYFNKSSAAQSYAINPTRAAFGSWWHPSSGGTNKSSRAKGVHFYSLQSRPRISLSGCTTPLQYM